MLRPDRRTRRLAAGLVITVTTLALIWPVSMASGRAGSSSTQTRGGMTAAAPKGARTASAHGLGVGPMKHGGKHQAKPLSGPNIDHTSRAGSSAGTDGGGVKAPASVTAAPVSVQATASGAPVVDSETPWDGLDQADVGLVEPPDPWLAVGPDDIVQSVNTTLRFTNRKGVATAGDVAISDLFQFDSWTPSIDGVGDPRWIYDAKHNRWIGIVLAYSCDSDGAAAGDFSVGYVWGAISTGPDPKGAYYRFYIEYPSALPDFPMVGTSGDKITISANEYTLNDTADCTTSSYEAGSMMTFDWAQMLTFPEFPDPTYSWAFDDWFSLRPALSPQGQSNTIYVVGEKIGATPGTSNVLYLTITGTNAAGGTVTSAEQDLSAANVVPPFLDPPRPTQPGGQMDAEIIDRRPTDAVWQNNVLTFASTVPCDPAGGVAETRDCARVTQLDTSTATPTRVQDMLVATSGKDTWYPGIGVSQSDILHVVYSQSSSTEGISSYDRYQLPSDPVNTLSAPLLLASGAAVHYNGIRWGDFVGVAQDPRDTNAVWQGNQYTFTSGAWATRVSELQTAGATFVPIDPVRVLDSRTNTGTTGAFVSSVPKTIQVAGALGIPNDAVAITGNLTVTGQQAAGFASLTQLPTANPSTSTLNFPLKDVRANNVTSPLTPSGKVSLVYKATAGKATHLVLDVTGYFLNDNTGRTYTDLAPVRVLDSRAGTGNIGLVGPIPSGTPKEFQVANVLTVPATAVAVTGNLTVTGQTRAGYVTLSSANPGASPATSTINFPAGDVRANGVTMKLSNTGSLWLVYVAPPGATVQVIFDVTGYYEANLNGARFVPLTPGRRMDTRVTAPQEGLPGPFSANIARTLVVEPYQGVPLNAVAITGNLTVVGQARAGYISMTKDTTNSPTTSTLNFPVGDVRANGVTGPLTAAGTVGLVYKASGGATHMILDVTGYFR